LLAKAALLAVIFLVVPLILYGQFRQADDEKQQLLLRSVREQGRVVAQAMLPFLAANERPALPLVGQELTRFSDEFTNIKLLFQPASGGGFFYIASVPPVPAQHLDSEREKLSQQGILDRLSGSCEGELPVALRYATPSGTDEIITSLTPLKTIAGCWAVVTSVAAASLPGTHLGVPYWATPEVKVAAVIYAAMVILSLTTFWSVRRGLRHFADRARAIRERGRAAGPFGEQNAMPELREVAEEFDRMVTVLHNSAEDIRRAAEDNAHAFKTPIAVIRQSLEPLRRSIQPDNQRAGRALGLIESSLDRLDGLVASARRLEHATADLIDTTRADIDLSRVLERLLAAHVDVLAERGLVFRGSIAPGVLVRADEEMVETVIENLLDNAISFSPEGESIGVRLEARVDVAELVVADSGPGVPPENVERIFDRYFSHRPPGAATDEHNATHFGIGLWVARRNIEALGGRIEAERRKPHGLLMRVCLPLAQPGKLAAPSPKIAARAD
jgi:two-component system, OmpR family, sensor histidine kinase ChvG